MFTVVKTRPPGWSVATRRLLALWHCVAFGAVLLTLQLLPPMVTTAAHAGVTATKPCVVLLHGLARTSASMRLLADALLAEHYLVANIDYPSRQFTIEELAARVVTRGFSACRQQGADRLHVVTHSLGGILLRQFLSHQIPADLGRVVMLAPPNQGSEVVDTFAELPGYSMLNGPAGIQLGTGPDSVPKRLGPVAFDVGIIAGTSTINPILSQALPNPDDGKVSVSSARVEGMCGFLTLPVSHPLIMKDAAVIAQVIQYLGTGRFAAEGAESLECKFRSNG